MQEEKGKEKKAFEKTTAPLVANKIILAWFSLRANLPPIGFGNQLAECFSSIY